MPSLESSERTSRRVVVLFLPLAPVVMTSTGETAALAAADFFLSLILTLGSTF